MSKNRASFNALAAKLGITQNSSISHSRLSGCITKEAKRNKFGAIRVQVDGIWFDSKKEGRCYQEFKYKKAAGVIAEYQVKKKYEFYHNGVKIGHYTCDFFVTELDGSTVVYDTKGGKATKTEAYQMRKRMMLAFYGINVIEI